MSLSDQLAKLSRRAKEAEDRAAAARDKARADLEHDVDSARSSAQAQVVKLHETTDAKRTEISDGWNDLENRRREHIATISENIDRKKAEHDVNRAKRRADNAEYDALFAIDFALRAIEGAEYAVLDAVLASAKADELSAGAGATT